MTDSVMRGARAHLHTRRRPSRSLNRRPLILFFVIGFLAVIVAVGIGWLVVEQNTIFSDYLDTYLAIHRFRMLLSTSERSMERYFRDREQHALDRHTEIVPTLWSLYRSLESSRSVEIEDYFQLRAISFGLLAYIGSIDRAAATDAYSELVRAMQIRRYVDDYAERLLQVRLDVGEAEVQTLTRRVRAATIGSGSAIGLLLAVMIGSAFLFSRTVTRPIISLAHTAHEIAGGNLSAPTPQVSSGDEIETLADAFALMQHNIQELIHDVQGKRELEVRTARLSQSLREAQLLGLQSQINPHFLFNTLNTVSRTALFEGATETTDLIQSLARVFRYMLQEPHTTVTLHDELAIVEEYVTLQRHRFQERLEFALECEVDPHDVSIPALTLQPLVENAIRHGIEPREEGGMVSVDCRLVDSHVVITVADSGVGMDTADETTRRSSDHIGLRNVRARLELLHGDALDFSVHSTPGSGTSVRIAFPAE